MNKIIEQCQIAISKYRLFTTTDKLLLACSGGKDSVALFHSLRKCGYTVDLAHVNFGLREDSYQDEKFVVSLAKEHNVTCYVHNVSEEEIPKTNIQQWARDVRYNFFERIINTPEAYGQGYDYILIAHNLDDYIESLLMNIAKGRNLWSDPGIAIKYGHYRRPLLLSTAEDIVKFLSRNKLDYRIDRTNFSDKYERNRVRMDILPILESYFPDLHAGVRNFIHTYYLRSQVADYTYAQMREKLIRKKSNYITINLSTEYNEELLESFLMDTLLAYQFHPHQINQIVSAQTGSIMRSSMYELLKDRSYLHLRKLKPKQENPEGEIQILKPPSCEMISYTLPDFILKIKKVSSAKTSAIGTEHLKISDKQFPLNIRKWKPGDRFQPLGMRGRIKVKKFLTEHKLNLWDKQNTYVLEDALGDIIWVIPHRISDKVRMDVQNSDQFFQISYVPI